MPQVFLELPLVLVTHELLPVSGFPELGVWSDVLWC